MSKHLTILTVMTILVIERGKITNRRINMKKIIFFLFYIFLACSNGQEDIEVGSLSQYDFNNDIQVDTIKDAVFYVAQNIKYEIDLASGNEDYWQTPEQTYTLKTGDCEDRAILLMYILKDKLDIDSVLLLVKNILTEEGHGMVFANDFYLLSADEYISKQPPTEWKIIHVIPYAEVLWMTCFYHENVGKYY